MPNFRVKVVLVDIEGTTTSISFVKDVLFPFAKENCRKYLQQTWDSESTQNIVKDLFNLPQYKEFCEHVKNTDTIPSVEQLTNFVVYLINLDLKLKPLKTLQGLIWEEGYKKGLLVGHVFDDVPITFDLWHKLGLRIAVYSSGSIWAQKLLFGQTKYGDLLKYISAHFDTTSGLKTEIESYDNIVRDLGVEAADVLFLTDVVAEAKAAQTAGLKVALLRRPGNADLPVDIEATYALVSDFKELIIGI